MDTYKKVAQFSPLYNFLRECLRFSFTFIYYRKFYIRTMTPRGELAKGAVGLPPKGTPMVVVSNHQNGLTDALLILFGLPRRFVPVFLSRADIFKKKTIAKLLYFFRIMPIYRMRDGRDNLGENENIFKAAGNVVKKGFPICIFPEGKHQEGHWFGPVKKGFARIAFLTAEKMDFPEDMVILPVGNHYEKYYGYRNSVIFIFGEPIPLSPYYDTYHENPQKAFLLLAEEVEKRINKLILNINVDADKYEILNAAREIERPKGHFSLPEKLLIDRQYMEKIRAFTPQQLDTYCKEISDRPRTKHISIWWILLSPIALTGFLLNGASVISGERLAKRLSRSNKMLRSGIEYVASEVLFTTILYLIYTILFFALFPCSGWWYIPFLAFLFISKLIWLNLCRR